MLLSRERYAVMSTPAVTNVQASRRIGRSLLALLAGFFFNVALSLATDIFVEATHILPAVGQPLNDAQSAIATAYRTVFSVLSSFVVARLAPYSPMGHALTGAAIGMVLATVGAIVTWNQNLGPHWYPIALVVLALPAGWVGGKLRLMQLKKADA